MQADRRPTVTDEVIAINDDLEINYGVFKNGFTFRRATNSWRLWPMLEFVPPRLNATIAEMYQAGVAWTLCEHVSICINGSADYVFEGPDGPIIQTWTPGCHNVENGGGYLPAGEFTRHFHDDFTLCCVVQKLKRTPGVRYRFEVLAGPVVIDRDALFVHYATGALARQTDFDLPAGHGLDLAPDDIAILCSIR
jgi:hypothetical protein